MVYGFGVEGEWLSEYVPSDKAEFYYTKNGTKVGGPQLLTDGQSCVVIDWLVDLLIDWWIA